MSLNYLRILDSANVDKIVDGTVTASYRFVPEFVTPPNPPIPSIGNAKTFRPKFVAIKTIDAANISSDCIISVGSNAPDYDNILKNWAVRPIGDSLEIPILDFPVYQFLNLISPYNTDVFIKVTSATADSFHFIVVFGYDHNFDIFNDFIEAGRPKQPNSSIFTG